MTAGWFGELYRETTAGRLTPRVSRAEAAVIAALLRLEPGERVLDVACGEGRHLAALAGSGPRLAGVDRDAASLRLAAGAAGPGAPAGRDRGADGERARRDRAGITLVRADFHALPFGPVFDAAWSWYSSLFLSDEAGNAAALAEVARVLRPGGRLLVQHANPARLAREPEARWEGTAAGGGRVSERARYDPAAGVETLSRSLDRGGRVLAGTVRLRYYNGTEWTALAARAGLRLRELASTGEAGPAPYSDDGLDLVAVLEKPT